MPIVQLEDLTIGYRGPPLLDEVTRSIEPGERIGLLGRNGSGKTTLMRIIVGLETPDHGRCVLASGARVALLPQDVPDDLAGTAAEVVRAGLAHIDDEHGHDWHVGDSVERLLARMKLPADADVTAMSAGMKRRTLLAQALVAEPDLLLLDEPTNHLDLEAIEWLESFLAAWPTTLLFVTHDRAFLRKLSTRIWEIDRGKLFDWPTDYDTFLVRKAEALAAEEKQNALFDKKLAQEEVWIRQGIKARRVRNEGRVRALKELRRIRSDRREQLGKVRLEIQDATRSGDLVAQLDNVDFAYDDRFILQDFFTAIFRGDKVGILGPNGAGKTTLLKVLLGQLAPQAGTVKLGTRLEIAYFDQLRDQLDPEKTIQENVAPRAESLTIGGRSRHIIGYLEDFLFTPERARTLVRYLSGGERHRVLLAKLFTQPANVIVLDEPTNDLDAETLELLEQRLVEFAGTILVVSHDREFLNNVATSVIAFEPGGVREYVGGYDDWVRQRKSAGAPPADEKKAPERPSSAAMPAPAAEKKKLTYKDQRELALLPAKIDQLETAIAAMHEVVGDPEFYKRPPGEIATVQAQLRDLEKALAAAFARWEELDS